MYQLRVRTAGASFLIVSICASVCVSVCLCPFFVRDSKSPSRVFTLDVTLDGDLESQQGMVIDKLKHKLICLKWNLSSRVKCS